MKQVSFKIDKICKIDEVENLKTSVEPNDKITCNLTSNDNNKNITSKKPIKLVENIYYFT